MAIDKKMIMDMVISEAEKQGVPVDLALALVNQESGFNPNVKSKAGAIGLMQLMPDTARSLGVNPYDISDNIRGGITYLKNALIHYNNNVDKALASYNAGFGAVDKYKGIPPYKETQNYVKAIKAGRSKYTKVAENASQVPKDIANLPTSSDGLMARMRGQTTGAAAPIPQVNEVMGIQTTPDQMYNAVAGGTNQAQQDALKALTYTQGQLIPTEAKALMNRTYGAGVQDYTNAYNTQIANLDKAYEDVQNTRATSNQELLAKFQAMRDLAAQDPRLQNQGYYIDPKVLDRAMTSQALMASPQNPITYQDMVNAQYQAKIANQYGVPYQEYLDSRLGNINNNMRIKQGEIEYLAARAAAGDTLAQQRLQAFTTAGTNYMSGLANAGKLDEDMAKAYMQAVMTGNTDLLKQFQTAFQNAPVETQKQIGDTLRSIISGQSGVTQTGISANSAETVAGINQQPKMLELPSQINLNEAQALKARGEGQMYGVAGGLDEGQASVINYGGNYTPVNPNANRQSQPLILWGGNNGSFFNLGGNK